jgi:hypothetical protein
MFGVTGFGVTRMVTVGQVVAGRYRITQPLAAGGLGAVWLAVDQATGEPVAVKKCGLPEGLTPDEQDLFRLWTVREARAFALVTHPNVIRTLDVLPGDDHTPWIVMEYVPSRSLQQVIDETGGLSPGRVAGIGLAVLDGLLAVRGAGLLHLDVKPGNVLIADNGRVVLTDFGPAVTAEGVEALAGAGIILASPKYLAPERLDGGVALPESDLWSLGATLYHAVEGRPPYTGATIADTLRALASGMPPEPQRAGPLAPVLAGLLRRDPADRLGPAELAEGLRSVAHPVREQTPVRVRTALRRRVAIAAVALGVLGALGTGAAVARPGGTSVSGMPRSPSPSAGPSPAFSLPAGFAWWADPLLYRVALPSGWTRRRDSAGGLISTAPGGRPILRVTVWRQPPDDVVAALIAQERATKLTAYRRIRIERLPDSPDAVWEYTYTDPKAGPMRGLQRVITTGGRTFAIDWRTTRPSWAGNVARYLAILDSFTPTGGG